jgi:hypothetical protein
MNFKIKKYISLNSILLLVVILIAVFFRFYNTPARYGFDIDPTRDALVVDYGAKNLQFPLVGPHSGIGPFTFGPWYYYQLILFKIILPVAYSPWIYIGILSAISVFVMYGIGVLLGGKKMGLLLAILTALTPAETGQIRALSNPTLIPLYATLTIWIFIKFTKENPGLWLALMWGLIMGIGINNHYQMLGLLPLPIILFIYRKEKRWLRILSFIGGVFIAFIPLFIYDFLHGGATVKGFIYYFTQGSNSIYVPNRWLSYVGNFWPTFLSYVLGSPSNLGIFIGLFMGVIILYLFLKTKISIVYIFLAITFIINFLMLRYFPGRLEYYYLLYLHPFLLIFFGLVILWMFNFKLGKYIGLFILVSVLIGMIFQSVDRLGSSGDQLQFKKDAQAIINNFPNKKFVLYECSSSQKNRIRGVVFFLNMRGKISEKGIKIAYSNEKCSFPSGKSLPTQLPGNINIFNISYAPDGLLSKHGWEKVTPKTVFTQLSQGNY